MIREWFILSLWKIQQKNDTFKRAIKILEN